MIQFNLLPDVKVEYIRAQRIKRVVMVIAVLAAAVSLGICILLFTLVNILQKNHMNNLSKDITKYTDELKAVPDLDKILTVQNQLNSLPALHDQKPVVARLYGYMGKVTPNEVSISKLNVDFATNVMTIDGGAGTLEVVNKFVDTLKFTTYQTAETGETGDAFSEVVLTSFTRNAKDATYKINLKYEPKIFNSANIINLTVPPITSTRSATEKPNPLFENTKPNPPSTEQ